MQLYALLLLAPAALACLNESSNKCASYIASNADAATFCATFTQSVVTATSALPAWATNCSQKPKLVSAECSCHHAGGGSPVTTTRSTTGGGSNPTTTPPPFTTTTGGGSQPTDPPIQGTPTKATSVFPSASGETQLPSATVISGVFDGGMKRWHRTSYSVCQGQTETTEADTIFILADGATLKNAIIGRNQAEGVHCRGTCTLINVWHEEVCEDAMTFKQSSGTSYVIGGGARGASDKIMQFNGRGTVSVKYFYAYDFGKVMRHCGNCSNNGGPRRSTFDGIIAKSGSIVVGINTNFGDTALLTNSCLVSAKYGDRYTGVQKGSEPKKIGSCPSSECPQSNVVTSC